MKIWSILEQNLLIRDVGVLDETPYLYYVYTYIVRFIYCVRAVSG